MLVINYFQRENGGIEMKTKFALLLAIIMLAMVFLPACGNNAALGNILNVNVGPDPDTIDPALNSSVDGATQILKSALD